jgi:hypothetical protein
MPYIFRLLSNPFKTFQIISKIASAGLQKLQPTIQGIITVRVAETLGLRAIDLFRGVEN